MSGLPPEPRRAPLWLLALITFSGTLAMHVFVPALPQAAAALGASPGSLQLTISFYIAGLAVGQLVYGPLSDRYGRRPVLLAGLFLYTTAGLAAALAPDATALIAARLFQALGGCAGLVLGRAIVRDGSALSEAAQRLATMNLMVALGPGLAPLLGTALTAAAGWRAVLWSLCGLGLLNAALAWRWIPAGVAAASQQDSGQVLRSYLKLLRSPAFLGYALGGGCATTSMYAFIAAAPFIITAELGRSSGEVGVYLAIVVFGIWLGSACASRLARRVRLAKLMVRGNLISLLGASLFLAAVVAGHLNVAVTVVGMALFTFGAGMAGPPALAEALSVNPKVAGSASGLYGFAQMGIGAVCTALAGASHAHALTVGIILVSAGLLSQLGFFMALRAPRLAGSAT